MPLHAVSCVKPREVTLACEISMIDNWVTSRLSCTKPRWFRHDGQEIPVRDSSAFADNPDAERLEGDEHRFETSQNGCQLIIHKATEDDLGAYWVVVLGRKSSVVTLTSRGSFHKNCSLLESV